MARRIERAFTEAEGEIANSGEWLLYGGQGSTNIVRGKTDIRVPAAIDSVNDCNVGASATTDGSGSRPLHAASHYQGHKKADQPLEFYDPKIATEVRSGKSWK